MIKTDYDIIGELLPDKPFGNDLYHYTSYEGLLGILEHKTIRCTHIFYLNDLEENLNAWSHFFEVLTTYEKDHHNYENFKKFIERQFANFSVGPGTLSSDTFRNIDIGMFRSFVFSFSEVEDDLNQWRAYTPSSFGFSINFKFDESLRLKQQGFHDNTSDPNKISNCKIFLFYLP